MVVGLRLDCERVQNQESKASEKGKIADVGSSIHDTCLFILNIYGRWIYQSVNCTTTYMHTGHGF